MENEKMFEAQIDAMLKKNQYSESYELVQEKLKLDEKNSLFLVLMGRITYALKEYTKAYDYFKQALVFDSSNKAAAAGILRVSTEIPITENQEELFYIINDYDHRDGYFARKDYYLSLNSIRNAVQEMKNAYAKFSLDEEVIMAYITVLIKNNVNDRKIDGLIEEVKSISDDAEILKLEITYLYKAGRYDDCEKLCKKIVRRYPNSQVSQTARELVKKIKQNQIKQDNNKTNVKVQFEEARKSSLKVRQDRIEDETHTEFDAEKELKKLIGLDSVKREIFRIKKKKEYDDLRRKTLGFDEGEKPTYHFVFSGNPGTGKTTVARLLADIFHEIGILEIGQLIETDRSGLVAEYIGQTATKTKDVIEKALGGVLFIDEAYGLVKGDNDTFGMEAMDALVKGIEDHRHELVVILAGYKDEMEKLISTNVGLESRITRFIDFPDYTDDELMEIAKSMARAEHYEFSSDGELAFREKIGKKKINKKFGNARTVRSIMEEAYVEKAMNLQFNKGNVDYMKFLTPADFGIDLKMNSSHKTQDAIKKLDKLIGLKNVKQEINSTIKMLDYLKKERENGNIDNIGVNTSMHMCFAGNPGTGKTTVARIYAEVLCSLGIAKSGEVLEVTRSDFVGRYTGETEQKTKELCEKSYGGVLFIDEAYDLEQGEQDTYGKAAVAELIKQMEDNRDKMIVIFAGYSKEMEDFMGCNSGIKSRISTTIIFPDYNYEELCSIFWNLVKEKNIIISELATNEIKNVIKKKYMNRNEKFGNAREMRNLFDSIWKNMVTRVETEQLEGDERRTFRIEDINSVYI